MDDTPFVVEGGDEFPAGIERVELRKARGILAVRWMYMYNPFMTCQSLTIATERHLVFQIS